MKSLQSESVDIIKHPLDGCSAGPRGQNLHECKHKLSLLNTINKGIHLHSKTLTDCLRVGCIHGPEGTPYEKGIFFLDISFPVNYPHAPPKVIFQTRIYHCNIDSCGDIGLNVLKCGWKVTMCMKDVLAAIRGLLKECHPHDAILESVGRLYLEDRDDHDRIAKEWTKRYAF